MPDSVSTNQHADSSVDENVTDQNVTENVSAPSSRVMDASNEVANETTADSVLPTVGQLTRFISQDVRRLYKERLGKSPRRVTCDLLSDKLIIWLEGSITPVEKLLFESGDSKAQSLCSVVDELMRQPIVEVIERNLNVKVVAMIADTCYEHECTGLIAKLSAYPKVRLSRRSQSNG